MDPELRRDLDFCYELDRDARFAYIDSLFFLASTCGPSGLYPHAEVEAEFGQDSAGIAGQLTRFGLWRDLGLGYKVRPYCGWRIIPDKRLPIPPAVRRAVYARDGYRCRWCKSGKDLTIDHIRPWSLGGSDHPDNLQTLCRSCNCRKGARIL